jgi:DNA-directed RNA polymerase subunit RPC12/RpoP
MRRLISLVIVGMALSIFSFASTGMARVNMLPKTEAAKPLIKCSTCGVEFTSSAGIEQHLKAHPEHVAAAPKPEKPLIRCSTCGVEFTSSAAVEDHVRAYPTHKAEPTKPLIKCSTCGVEFTPSLNGGTYEAIRSTDWSL